MSLRHGGKILTDQLVVHGVQRVFSVPGESFLAALDGLHDSGIRNIVCRHEGGAAIMAEATGKLTGRPGVVFVTRGPGATNASAGIHIARQDSTPLVMFVGQIARGHRDREAFQEVDYRAFFGPLAKWVAEVDQTDRLPEYISRAFHVAQSGRPGPVVLALPEDMLAEKVDIPDQPPLTVPPQQVSTAQVAAVMEALAQAERPLVVVGGSQWTAEAGAQLARIAERMDLPVAASFRRQDRFDNHDRHYVGDLGVGMNPRLGRRLAEADCLLVLGARLGDTATGGYRLLDPTRPGEARLLHVHPDPDELGRVFRPDPGIAVPAPDLVAALHAALPADGSVPAHPDRADWRRAARADYEAWITPQETPGKVKLERVVTWLSDNLPEDAIITNGAGNFAAWVHRYMQARRFPGQLAPISGSMGYGFPAAIAAKLERPASTVVCIDGDGCFQMTLNEMSTAVQHGAAPIVIVCNNGQYGTIRMHQERTYPGRVSGTALANPDFKALARAYGGYGERVERSADFPAAFQRALASGLPAVIELMLEAEALSPAQTLTQARAAGEAAQSQG